MRRMHVALVSVAIAVLALGACSSSSAPNDPGASVTSSTPPATLGSPTSTGGASDVQILSLSGPRQPVLCNSPTQVELHWASRNAKSVTLQINGGPVFASYPNGKSDELVPLACTGDPQTYLLTAHAANGPTVTKSLTLEERDSSAS